MLGLARRHAHDLAALERIDHRHHHREHCRQAVGEQRIAHQVVQHRRRCAIVQRDGAEDHQQADHDEAKDGRDLDPREPVFGFTEGPGGQSVEAEQHDHEQRRPVPDRHLREPTGHQHARRRELQAHGGGPAHPVHPTDHEAGGRADVFRGMRLERAGNGHLHRQLTQADHHQVHQQPRHQVGQDRPHRPALVDGHARAHEQAGADHPAQRQHEDVSALQRTGQLDTFAFGGVSHGAPRPCSECTSMEQGRIERYGMSLLLSPISLMDRVQHGCQGLLETDVRCRCTNGSKM
ncbi:hypothetical protein D3C81_1279630 [compost metagenome]